MLFWFFFLGVLGGWWKKGGELVARRVVCQWEWVDGIVVPVTKSLLLYSFSFFGVEILMGFSFPFSALKARGVLPSFLLSLPFSLFCLLASQVGLFPLR
jgi:hypothetical protein